jgi:hypothetical protein
MDVREHLLIRWATFSDLDKGTFVQLHPMILAMTNATDAAAVFIEIRPRIGIWGDRECLKNATLSKYNL